MLAAAAAVASPAAVDSPASSCFCSSTSPSFSLRPLEEADGRLWNGDEEDEKLGRPPPTATGANESTTDDGPSFRSAPRRSAFAIRKIIVGSFRILFLFREGCSVVAGRDATNR